MKNDVYKQIYDGTYRKNVLESILINLQKLAEKLEETKHPTQAKVAEEVETVVTNNMLKALLQIQLRAGNLALFSPKSLAALINKVQGITDKAQLVDVTIALPLTEPDLKEISVMLEKKLDRKVILNVKVDPLILGGVIIKADKYIFDSSLRSHLKDYENEWIKSIRKNHKAEDA